MFMWCSDKQSSLLVLFLKLDRSVHCNREHNRSSDYVKIKLSSTISFSFSLLVKCSPQVQKKARKSTLLEQGVGLGFFFQNWLELGKQTEKLLDNLGFILRYSRSKWGLYISLYISICTQTPNDEGSQHCDSNTKLCTLT